MDINIGAIIITAIFSASCGFLLGMYIVARIVTKASWRHYYDKRDIG